MDAGENPIVLFFLRRIGPYHHARFQEASRRLHLVAVETRPGSEEYPWKFTATGSYSPDRFPGADDPERGIRGKSLRVAVRNMFEKYRPQVAVTTGWADPEYHAIVLEAIRRGVPLVVISDSRFESEPRKFYKEMLKRIILKSYSAALVAGSTSLSYLLRLKFPPDAIFKPWDVVDNQYFATAVDSRHIPLDNRYFLCVSRFIPEKNIPGLIKAFHLYRLNGGKRDLVIAGGGALEGEARELARVLGIADFVKLPGFVQYESLPAYMAGALCLILPSVSDTWGLVVNEAMAAGLPVLVSRNCGCASDLVVETKNGCIFNPYDSQELARLMHNMDKLEEEDWKKMSLASTEMIKNWDLDAFGDGLVAACQHALRHPSRTIFKPIHRLLST